ncbi:MAG: hypothetical protein M0Z38_01950 [Deltaproteobacteria bacterium]|nr:hypothetical protein [Deltaproteobacteria bacterium]
MKRKFFGNRFLTVVLIVFSMLLIGGCDPFDDDDAPSVALTDPTTPWTVTATSASWLDTNPFTSKHDGGWVYSAREDRLYAMYGNDSNGQTLYRINHIDNTSSVATTFLYNRHGSHPVIDDTGTYIYQPPSQNTDQLERYNTVTDVLETLAAAPGYGTFSHGAWKNGKLWIVLDDSSLYSYNPADNTWSASLHTFGDTANVATSGPASNLIYIMEDGGSFFSYNIATDNVTTLTSHPNGFTLGGNSQFTWFGASVGFIYAVDGGYGTGPAIYDISTGTWQALSDPKVCDGWQGHATYDSSRKRLYVTGASNYVWYYQF